MERIILGGGITGLIAAHYLLQNSTKDTIKVISPNLGGQMRSPWAGPRFLHDTPHNHQFLEDIGLIGPWPTKSYTIGYCCDGTNVVDSIEQKDRETYYRKSRCLQSDEPIPDSVMSRGAQILKGIDVSISTIISTILDQHNNFENIWIQDTVGKIHAKSREIQTTKGLNLQYDQLITTLRADLFPTLLAEGIDWPELSALPKLFVRVPDDCDTIEHLPSIPKNYDYVYIIDPSLPYHRITLRSGEKIIEFTGEAAVAVGKEKATMMGLESLLMPNAQLVPTTSSLVYPENIYPLGRYACWKHGRRIEHEVATMKSDTLAKLRDEIASRN